MMANYRDIDELERIRRERAAAARSGKFDIMGGLSRAGTVLREQLPQWWKANESEMIETPDPQYNSVMRQAPYRQPTIREANPATLGTGLATTALALSPLNKPAIAAEAAMYAADAESATGIPRKVFDLLRMSGGNNARFRTNVNAFKSTLTDRNDLSSLTRTLTALTKNPELARRELATDPELINVTPMGSKKPRTVLTPDKAFKVGDVVVPVTGDATRAGDIVTHVGRELDRPVEMWGGPDFPLIAPTGDVWASNLGAAAGKQGNFRMAEGLVSGGGDVKGVHVNMSPEGAFFAKHPSELYLSALRAQEPPKSLMREFDRDVLRGLGAFIASNKKQGKFTKQLEDAQAGWSGIGSDDIGALLNENSEARRAMMITAAKPGWSNAGMPDFEMLQRGYTDPRFHGAATGDTGGVVFKADPKHMPLRPDETPHPTYDSGIPGEYVGELDSLIPASVMFPDAYAMKGKHLMGSLRTAHHAQPVTQQWLDAIMRYREGMGQ